MPDEIRVEWTYTPPHLFEERAELRISAHTCTVDAGRVTCLAPYEGLPEGVVGFCEDLHEKLEVAFRIAQMVSHEPFELSKPTSTLRSAAGGVHRTAFLETGKFATRLGRIDIAITDASGNVKVDTRADRIARRKSLAERAAALPQDPTLMAMLNSYGEAARNPANEMVYLHEIRDSVCTKFGGEGPTHATLGTSHPNWKRLGELTSGKPLLESRHRGQHVERQPRPATEAELAEARAIAADIVERYITYLERERGKCYS